jgi:CheY-like chemotaxis protein
MSKTVLLVEDDLDVRDVLQDLLEKEGYDVVPATNGKQALDYINLDQNGHLDLVILDLMTPIVTGWQVLENLRRHPELSHVPVIVVTAATGDKPSGANAFLRKPFRLDALFETVRGYLGDERPAHARSRFETPRSS